MSNKFSLYAQATRLSLENAKQWIKDAKLLLQNSSYGHVSALLRFACEEIAKAYVCWFTSEKIWPIENKAIRDVFRYHKVKIRLFLGALSALMWTSRTIPQEKATQLRLEPSDEEILEAFEQFEDIVDSTEKMRQKAIYVEVHLEKKEVETPLTIGEEDVKDILRLVEDFFLKMVKHYVEELPEEKKAVLREFFSNIPREAWKTGEIPIKWVRKKEG